MAQAIVKVFLDIKEAVEKAAAQNYERDHRKGITLHAKFENASAAAKEEYRSEARHLLTHIGENYLPEAPDTAHYCLRKE